MLVGKILNRVVVPMLAALVLSAVPAHALPGDRLIVPGERIGAADLAPADQGALVRALGEPDETVRQGGMDYYRYGAASVAGGDPDELVVAFDLASDAPFEISTASPLYRTARGLGVGSRAEQIRAALGVPICQADDGAGTVALAYDAIWFLLSRGVAVRVAIRAHVNPAGIRAGATVCR